MSNDQVGSGEQDAVADEWAAALSEQQTTSETEKPKQEYQSAPLSELDDTGNRGSNDQNLEVILDIPVTVSMEIGRTKISIRNLLQLNQGSVVELDRLAGEPMDVLVNGTLIAHGEVVVVNEKFGIRLTDVISAAERIKKLR
ncbi:MAG: flagellar motor switch protein FliN [Gammaproteobacteria bacterium]|nr:flagellar motor switch protein FliN [Gammaproteobacteria bacterium]